MLRTKLVLASVAASLFVAAPALAADATPGGSLSAGNKGNLIISADRVFGLSIWSSSRTTTVCPDATCNPRTPVETVRKDSYTQFGLLWGGTGIEANPYNTPRIGLDFTVIDGLTVGGSIGFISVSSKNSSEAGGTKVESDGPTYTAFALAPRVGYILGFSSSMGLWLRGGFTFFNVSITDENTSGTGVVSKSKDSTNGFAINLEPTFILSPIDHFAFTGGLALDVPLAGNHSQENTTAGVTTTTRDQPTKIFNFGLNFGIMGWL